MFGLGVEVERNGCRAQPLLLIGRIPRFQRIGPGANGHDLLVAARPVERELQVALLAGCAVEPLARLCPLVLGEDWSLFRERAVTKCEQQVLLRGLMLAAQAGKERERQPAVEVARAPFGQRADKGLESQAVSGFCAGP